MLADNRLAWDLQADGSYIQRRPSDNCPEANSQTILMNMVLRSTNIASNLIDAKKNSSYIDN
jgi:polyphosphate kinase